MAEIRKSILMFCKKSPRTLAEIKKKFNIPAARHETLRRSLKNEGVVLRENRGRKQIKI